MSLVPVSTASAFTADYFARDGAKEAFFLDFAIRPQALSAGGFTFVAYQGPGLAPHVAAFSEATGKWSGPVRVGDGAMDRDTHGSPSLVVDPAGYVHVFYGPHHMPMRHVRSSKPHDIDSWIRMPDIGSKTTYSQPILRPDGRLELFMRDWDAGQYWTSRVSSDGGQTWSAPTPILQATADDWWYPGFSQGADGDVVCTFVRVDYPSILEQGRWGRHDLYAIRRGGDGVWRTIDGAAITVPLQPSTAGPARVVSSGTRYVNQPTARIASDGSVGVLYLIGSGAGPRSYQWRFAHHDGVAWSDAALAWTDHFFDSASLRALSDGGFEAFVVAGGSAGTGRGDRTYEDRGGDVLRLSSADGRTWGAPERMSPAERGTLYNQPQVVEGADRGVAFMEWRNGASIEANRLYLHTGTAFAGKTQAPSAKRLAGADRYATAIRVSRQSFPQGAPVAVVVSGQSYPDGLVAGPLAVALDAPVLLVPRDRLPSSVAEEIRRLGARRVVVVGGEASLSAGVARSLDAIWGVDVERIHGSDRYETAEQVAKRLRGISPGRERAVVVSGESFADALSAGPLAAANGEPILLTKSDSLPAATQRALADGRVRRTLVLGGEVAVGRAVVSRLPSPKRVGGQDRYETSRLTAKLALEEGFLPMRTIIASGDAYPDGLSSATLAARLRAPLVLAKPKGPDHATETYMRSQRGAVMDLYLIGASAAVDEACWRGLQEAAFAGVALGGAGAPLRQLQE
jgi:putative cell wall-binding protein